MTLPELEQQILQLPIGDRWRLVQAVLTSIQQETQPSVFPISNLSAIADLDPWTQSLVGVMPLGAEDSTEFIRRETSARGATLHRKSQEAARALSWGTQSLHLVMAR